MVTMADRNRIGLVKAVAFLLLLGPAVACDSDNPAAERDATPAAASETTAQPPWPSTTGASLDPISRYVGLEYDQATAPKEGPPGVKHHGGGGLPPLGEPYMYEHVEHEGRHMLWLERFLRRPVTGQTGRLAVLDVHDMGRLPEGYGLQTVGCWPDDGRRPGVEEQGRTEPDLAVVVRYTPPTARFSTDISQAVRVNWSQKRFEPVPAAGWVCEWQGSGD
jgi:hypothetical protein